MAKGKYLQWLTEEGLLRIESWARRGLTDEELAHNMGISRSTLAEWKKKYSDISDVIKKGREITDILVENALFKRALGYQEEVPEVTVETTEKDGVKTKHTKQVMKVYPPDTGAAIFLLKNRMRDTYRERPMSEEERLKIQLSNEHQELQNEVLRRLLSENEEGLDLVKRLLGEIDEEALEETEGVLD